MNQNEVGNNYAKALLSKALLFSFGEKNAELLQDHCEFIELESKKIGIRLKNNYNLNDIEKVKIRKCIKSVYGEDIVIITASNKLKNTPEITLKPENSTNTNQNLQWLTLKNNIRKEFSRKYEDKVGEHILKNWFKKLSVSPLTSPQKLVLVGSSFVVNWIIDNYELQLERAIRASNFVVELTFEGNKEKPRIYLKEQANVK